MTSLESQYIDFLNQNPTSPLSYDEWYQLIWESTISDDFQIGPDGAFEYSEEE